MLFFFLNFQPGSAISAGTGSQASSGSRRAKTRQYYKVANTSQVSKMLAWFDHFLKLKDNTIFKNQGRKNNHMFSKDVGSYSLHHCGEAFI